jgi:hypothetical protein
MKSDITENKYYIECGCYYSSHLLVVDFDDDPDYPMIWVEFVSDYRKSLWERCIGAIKFIFNKEPYLTADAVLINEQNINQLEELVVEMKKFYKNIKTRGANENPH